MALGLTLSALLRRTTPIFGVPARIRKNFKVLNDNIDKVTADSETVPATKVEVEKQTAADVGARDLPNKDTPEVKFIFEEDGKPQQDEEEQAATTLDAWDKVRAARDGVAS